VAIIINFWSVVFLEIIFYGIVGHSSSDLGVFGRLHMAVWEWAWSLWVEVRLMWDIAGRHSIQSTQVASVLYEKLCRIFGVRNRQVTVADQGEGHLVHQQNPF
jgi:hypothetical protein